MTEAGELLPNLSEDERFAEAFVREGDERGFYVECYGMKATDGWTYYAFIMPKNKYEKLLLDTTQKLSGELPWDVLVAQSTFVSDKVTRRQALESSLQAFLTSRVQ